MTKFNFIISKTGTRYHFILSIAGINPIMKDSFVEHYQKLIGPLSTNEETILANIRKQMDLLPENDRKTLLRNSFLLTEQQFKKSLSSFDLLELFDCLDNKFESHWNITIKEIKKSLSVIQEAFITEKSTINKAINTLGILFKNKAPEQIEIYLMSSPINNISGKLISPGLVYIEIPRNENIELKKFWLVLIHEIIHACFESFEYKMWLKDFAEKQIQIPLTIKMGPKNILRELVDEAIAPNGYFANYLYSMDIINKLENELSKNKGLDFKNDREEFNYLKKVVALNLFKFLDSYIKESKLIDEKILEIIWESILNQ